MIKGSIVAIVTPMHPDGSLDFPGLRKLIDWHIAEGTDGIVIVGTTGESPTVSVDEPSEAIELTAFAKKVGADASLQVVPYYNRPTQEGMYLHFKKIAESVDLPVILYNVPGRTVADMSNDTVLRLAQVPGIVGVKDATGNIARGTDLIRLAPKSFAVYSGDDAVAIALMLYGGQGNISVTANVAPRDMHELCVAAMSGNVARAIELNNKMLPLHNNLFVEPNPVPVKWAMIEMGLIESGMRLPLAPLGAAYHETVRAALRESGVLK